MDGDAVAAAAETVYDELGFPVPAELVPAYTAAQDALRTRDRKLAGLWRSAMRHLRPDDSAPLPDRALLLLFSSFPPFFPTHTRVCTHAHGATGQTLVDNADFRQLVLKGIDPEYRKEVCCC